MTTTGRWLGGAVAVMMSAVVMAGAQSARTAVGPAGQGWVVDLPALAGNVKFEPFLGRDAMWLKSNTHVVKAGLDLRDGTIEFDLAPMDQGDFAAITFRRASFADHENIYLRLRRSGDFMALQYAPRVKGSSTWQLYRDFSVEANWPRNQWTHVRVELRGSKMDVYVGNATTPALSVPRLRNGTTGGEVGFWARVNDRPEAWAAAISNLQIRPSTTVTPLTPAASAPPEYLSNWQISGPVPAKGVVTAMPPAPSTWIPASAEESGLVNVNRLFPVQKQRSMVLARHIIRSDTARRVLAGFGYSDDVTVFLNGEPVYTGQNGWDSRTPQLASFVDARWESVFLPLRSGDNELVLAVTDDQRFGWGFAVRLADRTGLQ